MTGTTTEIQSPLNRSRRSGLKSLRPRRRLALNDSLHDVVREELHCANLKVSQTMTRLWHSFQTVGAFALQFFVLQSLLLAQDAAAPAGDSPKPAEKSSAQPAGVPDVPLPMKPYSVQVIIGFDGVETGDPDFRSNCVSEIRKGLDRMFGPMWDAQVAESDWLIPANEFRLRRLSEAEFFLRYPDVTTEKVFVISVASRHGGFEISCLEYDSRVQEVSQVLSESTHDVQSLARIACRLARDCFRPVLLLSGPSIDKKELEFELQAGTLPPPDPSAAQIAEGDVLRTFLRQMERRNPSKLKLLQKLDLCYVRVTSFNEPLPTTEIPQTDDPIKVERTSEADSAPAVDSGHVRGVLISHGPVPFGGRGRSLQQIGLRQRPAAQTSRVRLVLQSRSDRPLICYRVDKVLKLLHTDVTDIPNQRILTDRNGELELAVDPEHSTFWLYVYSGSLLLARVPYAPGIIPQDTIRLPDDSLRLEVEGELYLFRDELVDSVAQKAVAMSLAKKAATTGNTAELEAAIARIDALPGKEYYDSELNSIQTPAVSKADQQKNRGARLKIEKLCKSMSDSLTVFFSAEKRLKEAEEIQKLRQSAGAKASAAQP